MKIEIQDLTKTFGNLTAVDDISLTIEDGEFLTLVGPSGCGKSTMLRCLTGLESPSSGRILFDGVDITDRTPQERGVAMVFQNYALYPHMTARRNLSFALEDQGIPDDEIDRRITDTANMLGIGAHLEQRPEELSGGQKQRVALGRSLVRNPDVILMDEPLSNLDAKLRIELRAELQKIHQEFETTTVYVTHDQEEAMTMSDRIAVLSDGTLQQLSSPEDAYNRPTNRFVAEFIGSPSMNFLSCELQGSRLQTNVFSFEAPEMGEGSQPVEVGVRPEDLRLTPDADTPNSRGTVSVFEHIGPYNLVYVDIETIGEVVAQVPPTQYFGVGDEIALSIRNDRAHVFDATGNCVYNPPLPSEEEEEDAPTPRTTDQVDG